MPGALLIALILRAISWIAAYQGCRDAASVAYVGFWCCRRQDGFPQMDRDLVQVEQLSLKLKAKTSRLDQPNEELAASRLLAQQGVNAHRCHLSTQVSPRSCPDYCDHSILWITVVVQPQSTSRAWRSRLRRYNRDLLELELHPTHEDVFTEATTVDEYLQQVHESTVVSAIQVQLYELHAAPAGRSRMLGWRQRLIYLFECSWRFPSPFDGDTVI